MREVGCHLPHDRGTRLRGDRALAILVRFFTVPDARAARRSVGRAVLLIGAFYVMIVVIGVGARAILGSGAEEASAGGNLAIRRSWRSSVAVPARSAATSSSPS